jgi:Putative Flp pilus-assembly TadE/G-like
MDAAERARGQILPLFAVMAFVIIAMVGLIIEGGNVFGQQRIAQNGADSSANAGALVIAEHLAGAARTGDQVRDAIHAAATDNGLASAAAEYTNGVGSPLGIPVGSGAIPDNARGVKVGGDRAASATFSRILGFTELKAAADATAVAGRTTGDCVLDDDGCTVLPVTFPVQVSTCDGAGNLEGGTWVGAPPPGPEHEDDDYWPLVDQGDLPSATDPDGNTDTMAILSLCRAPDGASGAFGWLELDPSKNLAREIEGPLNTTIDLPDWIQTQPGNPNSVEDELEAYIHQPVLIPLHNGACREDPGADGVCDDEGVDPVGSNTWYYVHTLAVFYPHEFNVSGANVDRCASGPGTPTAPVTSGTGFLGCMKGWFVSYVVAGPIVIGNEPIPAGSAMGTQLIR